MRDLIIRALVIAVSVSTYAGCARVTHGSASRFITNRESASQDVTPKKAQAEASTPPEPTLEEAIAKVRRLMAEARPGAEAVGVRRRWNRGTQNSPPH